MILLAIIAAAVLVYLVRRRRRRPTWRYMQADMVAGQQVHDMRTNPASYGVPRGYDMPIIGRQAPAQVNGPRIYMPGQAMPGSQGGQVPPPSFNYGGGGAAGSGSYVNGASNQRNARIERDMVGRGLRPDAGNYGGRNMGVNRNRPTPAPRLGVSDRR